MAQQEEPLYDFPEPSQDSQRKLLGHQRGRGSLRSISVLDRLLLTVPVWLQLSINPATALHILRREPPGNFLVRNLFFFPKFCFFIFFHFTPCSSKCFFFFYIYANIHGFARTNVSVSVLYRVRDVLPFPLELPDAIAKAASHKELESISHMGIAPEGWSPAALRRLGSAR
uniref:Uncharacterized protein n=1 Tax=Acanthochromis polyacanthus TaxID=80966 RepID=A0A3Q1FVE1_9TELE